MQAIAEFNAGLFFEQHETLEVIWLAERSMHRGFLQGILQIGVACHHWRAGNRHGARTLLRKGIRRLGPFGPECRGFDVAALVRDASELLERLDDSETPFDLRAAPRIRLVGSAAV